MKCDCGHTKVGDDCFLFYFNDDEAKTRSICFRKFNNKIDVSSNDDKKELHDDSMK